MEDFLTFTPIREVSGLQKTLELLFHCSVDDDTCLEVPVLSVVEPHLSRFLHSLGSLKKRHSYSLGVKVVGFSGLFVDLYA